jgi:hypothetical protein
MINLTPHAINIVGFNGEVTTIPPSGKVARVKSTQTLAGNKAGIPLYFVEFGAVEDLPNESAIPFGVEYIVSGMVRAACPNRRDLASPGDLVRDDKGNVVGCRGLIVT